MPSIENKPQLTGIIILFGGVALLAFTFLNAYWFLQEPLGIIATGDLARVFGDALAPLIQASIRLMYLGIMGWIGSLLTIRGIPLITHKPVPVAAPLATTQTASQPQQQPAPQPQPQPVKQPQTQPAPQPKPVVQPTPQPTPSQTTQPQPKPEPSPTPQPRSQSTPQQPEQKPQPQPQTPQQASQPTPQTRKEEPEAILIPPENQREE